MEQVPLFLRGEQLGHVQIQEEGLYLRISARCPLPDESLWCAWMVGTHGKIRLGIMEPKGGICRRISRRELAAIGHIKRGEVRLSGEKTEGEAWGAWNGESELTDKLRLKGVQLNGALYYHSHSLHHLAVPYVRSKPFPLPHMFCFAAVKQIRGKQYAVYCLDEAGWPRFP